MSCLSVKAIGLSKNKLTVAEMQRSGLCSSGQLIFYANSIRRPIIELFLNLDKNIFVLLWFDFLIVVGNRPFHAFSASRWMVMSSTLSSAVSATAKHQRAAKHVRMLNYWCKAEYAVDWRSNWKSAKKHATVSWLWRPAGMQAQCHCSSDRMKKLSEAKRIHNK